MPNNPAYFSQVFKTDTLPSPFIKFTNFTTINYQLVITFIGYLHIYCTKEILTSVKIKKKFIYSVVKTSKQKMKLNKRN